MSSYRNFLSKGFQTLFAFSSFLIQLLGGLILALAFLPGVVLFLYAWRWISGIQFLLLQGFVISLLLGLVFFMTGDLLLVTVVLVRKLFRLRNSPEEGVLGMHAALVRLAIYNYMVNLVQVLYLPLIRSTPILNWFYRGMGARIGHGTLISTTRIFDCDLIEIGSDCIIGGGVAINAHSGQRNYGVLEKVIIGDNVTIGADAYIMPGVVIEDNVLVGPKSFVPRGKRLEAEGIYIGVPVRRITAVN
jgi:serine acetyltransferase